MQKKTTLRGKITAIATEGLGAAKAATNDWIKTANEADIDFWLGFSDPELEEAVRAKAPNVPAANQEQKTWYQKLGMTLLGVNSFTVSETLIALVTLAVDMFLLVLTLSNINKASWSEFSRGNVAVSIILVAGLFASAFLEWIHDGRIDFGIGGLLNAYTAQSADV
eukprot:TRINITY_DN438_c0_g1_i3.p1 TRINITY_DN438_c0_g1~~TRINITY_DN438_c0_g1_i3.p1  ORF type:complete len:166 (+),score=18.28 TRINITY_DN438_c0_g1_i3:138-635(+)